MFLLAYTPPSNIAQEILEIKTAVFRRWGTPSAIALPPLAPLRLFEKQPKQNDIKKMYDIAGRQFSAGGYTSSGNSLFIDVDLGIHLPEQGKGVLPLYPGFHILSREKAAPSFDEIVKKLNAPPDLRWTTGELTLFSLNMDPVEETWWNCIRFEEVYCIKVRKGLNRKN